MGVDNILMKDLIKAINRLNKNIEAQNAPARIYVQADEAALIVGLTVTKRRSHRNRLTAAYKNGWLPNTIPGRPYQFHVDDLKKLAEKRISGKAMI